MKIIRKTLDGTSTAFTFNVPTLKFLVKNFTSGDIYVNTENITDENLSSSIKIPKDVAQLVITNEYLKGATAYSTLYVKGTGEVEVQAICY